MTRRTLFAAALALTTIATCAFAAQPEGTFDKTFSVSGSPTVLVSTGAGYIHVTPGSDNQVHIVGHVRSNPGEPSSETAVQQIVAAPPITQSGNTITIAAKQTDSNLYHNISIDYDVTTPRSTNLTARTGSGSMQVTGLQAPVSAESGSGSLRLSLAGSTDVKAQTGSGSIHIEGVTGALQARTGSGSIDVAGNLSTDWHLSTGSGAIRIKLPDNARFTLDAGTGSGTIQVAQPIVMQGSLNRHHVSGTVNGGGPTLRASTGSGSIIINGNTTVGQLQENNSLHVHGVPDCVDSPNQAACTKN